MTVRSVTLRLVAVAVVTSSILASSCSDEDQQNVEDDVRSAATEVAGAADDASENAVEVAARNFVSVQGEQQFENAGFSIPGNLSCTADASESLTAVEISCSGTTDDRREAELTGTTSELPGASFDVLDGEFVGRIDGSEVFRTDRLGA